MKQTSAEFFLVQAPRIRAVQESSTLVIFKDCLLTILATQGEHSPDIDVTETREKEHPCHGTITLHGFLEEHIREPEDRAGENLRT